MEAKKKALTGGEVLANMVLGIIAILGAWWLYRDNDHQSFFPGWSHRTVASAPVAQLNQGNTTQVGQDNTTQQKLNAIMAQEIDNARLISAVASKIQALHMELDTLHGELDKSFRDLHNDHKLLYNR